VRQPTRPTGTTFLICRHSPLLPDGQENRDAAWYYPDPKPAAAKIKDHIAFWRGVTVER
jgi:uncharacterized protein (DUF427 family)